MYKTGKVARGKHTLTLQLNHDYPGLFLFEDVFCVCAMCVPVSQNPLDSLELALQALVSHLTGMLGTEFRSSRRAVEAIPLVPSH